MVHFELWRDRMNLFRLSLDASNGSRIFTTEGYSAKQGALEALAFVRCWAPGARLEDNA